MLWFDKKREGARDSEKLKVAADEALKKKSGLVTIAKNINVYRTKNTKYLI